MAEDVCAALPRRTVAVPPPVESEPRPRVHDVLVVGGGMAGLSTARASAQAGLDVLVLEQGRVCAQGATAAAKQAHVFVIDGEEKTREGNTRAYFRSTSLRIYREMSAAGYDVGLREKGSGLVIPSEASWGSRFSTWMQVKLLRLSGLSSRLIHAEELGQRHLHGWGAVWNEGAAQVHPCKALRAWKSFVEAKGGVVREQATLRTIAHDGATYRVTLEDGTVHLARSLVVAVGVWSDRFMRAHLPECAKAPRVHAVASQIAVYRIGPEPMPASAATLATSGPTAFGTWYLGTQAAFPSLHRRRVPCA